MPSPILDQRSQVLLKALIEQHIINGKPVGSRTLSRNSGLNLCAASVRNIMADLEENGYLSSNHTSAGRVPTDQGYRFFVDTLLTLNTSTSSAVDNLGPALQQASPQQLIKNASELLAQLTHFVGLVATPSQPAARIRQMEFIPLAKGRTLLVMVNEHGEVQNRVIHTQVSYSAAELEELSDFISERYHMLTFDEIHSRLSEEIQHLRHDMVELMRTILTATEMGTPDVVMHGEDQLLYVEDWGNSLEQLQQVFSLLKQKSQLSQLLELAAQTEGVKIFIGKESGLAALAGCSVVASPYVVNNQVVGSLCIVGPVRMPYESVIPVVAATAKLLSNALSKI